MYYISQFDACNVILANYIVTFITAVCYISFVDIYKSDKTAICTFQQDHFSSSIPIFPVCYDGVR